MDIRIRICYYIDAVRKQDTCIGTDNNNTSISRTPNNCKTEFDSGNMKQEERKCI